MPKKGIILRIAAILLIIAVLSCSIIIGDVLRKETAYQLTVDGEIWFAVAQKDALESMLKEYQDHYLANIDENARMKNTIFLQQVEIVEVRVKPEEIESLEAAKEKIYAPEEEAVEVEVKSGDNFWNLAKANHISVSELEILNPTLDPEKLFPGDKLIVKPFNPVLDVIIELENTIVESVPFKTESRKNNNLYKNQKKIIREGIEGQKEVVYHITLLNGYQSSLEVKDEKSLKEPINALVEIGTKTTVSRGGRINFGVVSGKRISSYYGFRIHPITGRRIFHDGLDIAANQGNSVYAYSEGRVVEAGWNGGYGYCVLIDHGNNLKTRYAHLSKINVRIGQRVGTGHPIGAIGSTGNSTGPHLHFEVIQNGQTKNPLNYL